MRLTTLLAGCAFAALLPTMVLAQTSPAAQSAPPPDSSAQPGNQPTASPTTVGEIVVTARRREERLKDVPVAVTAITGDAIREQQLYTVRDVLNYAPGVNVNSDSVGRAFISIRGIGTTLIDTVQPGVGIFIDGVYQPNTSYLNSPLVDVDRVEILRGPQGTLFGNNTLGGAINVITRQPSNQFQGRIDGAYAGPDDFRSLSASVSGPIIEDVLQARLGVAYHQQDGFQKNLLAGGYQNPLLQQTVSGSVRFTPAPWAVFTLNVNRDRIRGGNTPYLDVNGPHDYTLDGSSNQRNLATVIFSGVDLKGEFSLDPIKSKLTAVAAYNRRDLSSAGDADFSPIDFIRSAGNSRIITTTGELRLDTNWSDRVSTLLGVFDDRFTTRTSGTTTIVPYGLSVPSSGLATNDTQAVYGTAFIKLTPTLDFSAGLRYDHQTLNATTASGGVPFTAGTYKANELEPRFTLSNKWTPDFMTYASIARGFRGGGQNGPGAPNLIYKGDSVWTYELGSKFSSFAHRLSVETAIFYNDYDNFIGQNALAPSTTGAGYVAINLNTGHVSSYGAELETTFQATTHWRWYGNATLLHARITNDNEFYQVTGVHVPSNRIIFTPDWDFTLGTNYTVPLGANELVFDANVVAKGDRLGSSLNPNYAPVLSSYYLVNASIAYHISKWEIALFATNLFDEKYIESYIDISALERAGVPPPIASNLAVQGDRRRVGVRASIRF